MTSGIDGPWQNQPTWCWLHLALPGDEDWQRKGADQACRAMREPRLVNWRPRSSMRRGAKSKGFMHAQGLAGPSRSRIKDLQCQRNLPPPGGWRGVGGDIRGLTLLPLRQGRGTGGRFFNRADGAAIAAAARDHLTAIERQLEVAVRTWHEPRETGQNDHP